MSPKILQAIGISCVAGFVIGSLILGSVILFEVGGRQGALSWAIGLLAISLAIPSLVAEADLRSRPGGLADKRIRGDSQLWGTMSAVDAFDYLLRDDRRTVVPRDKNGRAGA